MYHYHYHLIVPFLRTCYIKKYLCEIHSIPSRTAFSAPMWWFHLHLRYASVFPGFWYDMESTHYYWYNFHLSLPKLFYLIFDYFSMLYLMSSIRSISGVASFIIQTNFFSTIVKSGVLCAGWLIKEILQYFNLFIFTNFVWFVIPPFPGHCSIVFPAKIPMYQACFFVVLF